MRASSCIGEPVDPVSAPPDDMKQISLVGSLSKKATEVTST